jgi:chromosome condensin MukBEF ATPase and DNA-binding subunit MukB
MTKDEELLSLRARVKELESQLSQSRDEVGALREAIDNLMDRMASSKHIHPIWQIDQEDVDILAEARYSTAEASRRWRAEVRAEAFDEAASLIAERDSLQPCLLLRNLAKADRQKARREEG